MTYDEIRIDVRDPQLTHVYVFCSLPEMGHVPTGWRHKAFPAKFSSLDILTLWAKGKEDPLKWDMGSPGRPEAR